MRRYPAADEFGDWLIALRQQIEQIARRNSSHKKYAQVLDRTQEMDDLVFKLRELVDISPGEAARLQVQAMSILDETDRMVAAKLPTALPFPQLPVTAFPASQSGILKQGSSSIRRLPYTSKVMPEISTKPMRVTTFADSDIITDEEEQVSNKKEATKGWWWLSLLGICPGFRSDGSQKERQESSESAQQAGWNFFGYNLKEAVNLGDDSVRKDLWKTQFEFFLSILGFMVGVGNFLKFPSLAYQHGGGVFLIPYFVCLVLFGLPIVYMHLCIGQYSGLSASGAFWKMMPIASGIGWALVLLAFPVSIYYNIIVAWSIHYFWYSLRGFFTSSLPWDHCSPEWPANAPCCLIDKTPKPDCFKKPHAISSPEAYFHYEVLNRTAKTYVTELGSSALTILNATNAANETATETIELSDLDASLGPIQSHLVLSLAFAWIIVFFGVFKGVGSIGWAVTFTATLPYLLLTILLLRGMSLPGADVGLAFFFKPDVEKLWSIPIWKAAAEQVFYSLGIDAGPLISMASFSRFRNNIYRDAVAVVLINSFTSVLAGMIIFSFIGFLAQSQQLALNATLQHDSLYVAFTVYPGVTSFMDTAGPLWGALFFGMLTLSAVDAEFAWIEMIISSILNQFGRANRRIEIRLVVGICFLCFVTGLPLTTRGGIYIFHSVENLNSNWNSFSLSLVQIIIVCYVYGVDKFLEDVGDMLRVPTSLTDELKSRNLSLKQVGLWSKVMFFFGPTGGYIRWTWSLFSPCILAFLLVASAYSYQPVEFEGAKLPMAYELVAWVAMIGPLFVVPFTAFHTLYKAWKNNKPLLSVFDCGLWRHKRNDDDSKEPKHRENDEHDYWSIVDPVSRVASARHPNAAMAREEVGYSTMVEIINEWARKNAAVLGDRVDVTSDEQIHVVEPVTESKSSLSSRSSRVRRSESEGCVHSGGDSPVALFGAGPSGSVKKAGTVIHKSSERITIRENPAFDVQTPYGVAKFNRNYVMQNKGSAREERSVSEVPCVVHRSSSADAISRDSSRAGREKKSSVGAVQQGCSSQSTSPTSTLPSTLHGRLSVDHQSLGSISITPIDASDRNRSTSSASNFDAPSGASSDRPRRRRFPALMRPKPIDAPPPFNQL